MTAADFLSINESKAMQREADSLAITNGLFSPHLKKKALERLPITRSFSTAGAIAETKVLVLNNYRLKEPLPFCKFNQQPMPQWPADYPTRQQPFPVFLGNDPHSEPIIRSHPETHTKEERAASRGASSCSLSLGDAKEVFNWKRSLDQIPRDSLVFESNFECGNLKQAYKTGPYSYNLKIREDSNTSGHTQWFFFKITNMVAGIDYEFQISNIRKKNSLYAKGLRPLLYSDHLAQVCQAGWSRIASDEITYVKNYDEEDTTKARDKSLKKSTYTLVFKLQFPQTRDTVYLSHCFPYSYSQLQNDISSFKLNPKYSNFLRHKILGKTVLDNNLDMLCVTSKADSPKDLQGRQAIIILSRIHPGETNSSYFIKGFLTFLLGDSAEAQNLRNNFVFKIVPMMNPDGVILGNHRCNFNGYDLNRAWQAEIDDSETIKRIPEINLAKKMISKTAKERTIAFFCDIHGHNKQFDAFLYGCHNNRKPDLYLTERIFPYLLNKQHPGIFSFARSNFAIRAKKQGTARVFMRTDFDINNTFTLEISFAGKRECNLALHHYTISSLLQMGEAFCSSVHAFVHNVFDKKVMDSLLLIFGGFDDCNDNLETDEYSDDSSSDDEPLRKPDNRKFGMKKLSDRSKKSKSTVARTRGDTIASSNNNSRPSTPSSWSSSSSLSTSSSRSQHLVTQTAKAFARIPFISQSSKISSFTYSNHISKTAMSHSAMSRRRPQSATETLLSNEIDRKPSLTVQNFEVIKLKRPASAAPTHSKSISKQISGAPTRNQKMSLAAHSVTILPIVTMIDAQLPKGIIAEK